MNIATKAIAAGATVAAVLLAATPAHAEGTDGIGVILSCRSGGSRISVGFTMTTGTNADGVATITYHDAWWDTKRRAKFDRIAVSHISEAGDRSTIFIRGGAVRSQNDVPSYGVQIGKIATRSLAGSGARIHLSAWGGKGNSRDTCTKTKSI